VARGGGEVVIGTDDGPGSGLANAGETIS